MNSKCRRPRCSRNRVRNAPGKDLLGVICRKYIVLRHSRQETDPGARDTRYEERAPSLHRVSVALVVLAGIRSTLINSTRDGVGNNPQGMLTC